MRRGRGLGACFVGRGRSARLSVSADLVWIWMGATPVSGCESWAAQSPAAVEKAATASRRLPTRTPCLILEQSRPPKTDKDERSMKVLS
jgi:hypothetical protein